MNENSPRSNNPYQKGKHLFWMIVCCLVVIGAIIILPRYFSIGTVGIILLLLLCPISHYFLMRKICPAEIYQCPECGFWYKEKEWAEKCEAWCKKHKSCNLEITKHAIKRSEKDNN